MFDCSNSLHPAYGFADAGIPALTSVLDLAELRKHLPSRFGEVLSIELQVLQHYPGKRCTVNIELQTTTGKHELIGKIYTTDRSDVYDAMRQIGCAGFLPETEFSIPQPLAYVASLNFLLL